MSSLDLQLGFYISVDSWR